jgi:hypothetical protein
MRSHGVPGFPDPKSQGRFHHVGNVAAATQMICVSASRNDCICMGYVT